MDWLFGAEAPQSDIDRYRMHLEQQGGAFGGLAVVHRIDLVADEALANLRRAALLLNVHHDLIMEALEAIRDGSRRRLAVGAVGPDETFGKHFAQVQVAHFALAARDAAEDLGQALRAAVAGRAAAARLVLAEPLEVDTEIDDTGRLTTD